MHYWAWSSRWFASRRLPAGGRGAPASGPRRTRTICGLPPQARYAAMLLAGEKTIELRRYAVPERFLGACDWVAQQQRRQQQHGPRKR